MAKVISLSKEAYNKLSKIKNNRSFSEVIINLISKNNSSNKEEILKFFGSDLIDEKKLKYLSKGWKKWSERYV